MPNDLSKDVYIEPAPGEGLGIDYKRVIYRATRFWYIIILSVLMGLLIAFLANRYTTRIYPVTASLIVKEADDISGAELLYNNPLLNFKRNYLNETYILKSYPLVQRVIEDLSFDVSFYQEGNILTTEAYGEVPIRVVPIRDSITKECNFDFMLLSKSEFSLRSRSENDDVGTEKFVFGDTVRYGGFIGAFLVDDLREVGELVSQPLIFTYSPPINIATRYVENLKAEWAEEGAGVVNLSISGSNPKKEKDFLTGLIAQYQNNDLEIKNETASRTVEFISDQLEAISDSLHNVERRLERFKDKNVITDLKGEALRLYEKVEQIEAQKAQLNISRNYYRYLIDYIQRNQDLHQIILPSSVGIVDPILTALVSKMNETQMDIKMLGKSENPLVTEGIRRINEMKKDIVESVKNQESTDNIKLEFLNKQIAEIEKQLSRLPLAERTLVSIQRNYALQENLYIYLLQKRSEAAISKASNTSDIVLVNPPRAGQQVAPKTKLNYFLFGCLGLALPICVFVLIEVFDNRIQSKEDIEKITSIPFIGGVGHKKSENNLAVFNQPKSVISESFRALRSNLNYFIGHKDQGVFLITSSISGEGKTFTTVNLASVLALSGKRTLIVGADMRRPKLSDDFDLPNDVGLSTFLAKLADFKAVRKKTKFENLDIISGGPVPPNPSELLLTGRMRLFIEEAKEQYDYIIIDTPPLALVTDAFELVPYADHTLFLIRQNYTPKSLLKATEDFYKNGKLKKISIVLNDILKSGPGYGYGYGYSYGYGNGYAYYGAKKNENGLEYYQ